MEITQLKQIGKSENYRVYLDDNFVCCLTLETIVKNKIKCGDELEKEELSKMQFESEKITAFERATNYISKSLKTQGEVKKYLISKGYFESIIDYVCEKLLSYGYLNDKEYARQFVNNYANQKGKKAISFLLFQKGVDKKIIDEELANINQDDAVFEIATKYMKNKEYNLKTKQSLYRYLLSKGFSYGEVGSAVNKLFSEE